MAQVIIKNMFRIKLTVRSIPGLDVDVDRDLNVDFRLNLDSHLDLDSDLH